MALVLRKPNEGSASSPPSQALQSLPHRTSPALQRLPHRKLAQTRRDVSTPSRAAAAPRAQQWVFNIANVSVHFHSHQGPSGTISRTISQPSATPPTSIDKTAEASRRGQLELDLLKIKLAAAKQRGWMLRMWTIVLILAVIVACVGTYVTFAYGWEAQVPAYLWYTGMWLLLFLAYWIHSSTSHIHHQSSNSTVHVHSQSPSATVPLHSQTPSLTISGAPAQKLEVDHPKIKTSNDSQWDWMLIITIILW
jgi:hypothetical protein